MTVIRRFSIICAAGLMTVLAWSAVRADDLNQIGFCANDPSQGAFHSVGVSGLSCSRNQASSQAMDNAMGFAVQFAFRCPGASLAHCTAVCNSRGARPLSGADAHGATFSPTAQAMRGGPADRVVMVNRVRGFCAGILYTERGSTSFEGGAVCPNPFFVPPLVPKVRGTAKADVFCGCSCH
jgi:hypothetical protein